MLLFIAGFMTCLVVLLVLVCFIGPLGDADYDAGPYKHLYATFEETAR